MHYERVLRAEFLSRPNRFIAKVQLQGEEVVCHVKNTGRCRELLVPGATVYLEDCRGRGRKTDYDLIAVEKGSRLINMDAMAPNRAAGEWMGQLFPDATRIRPETTFGGSRFDFYIETPERRIYLEVKGVTLEEEGVVRFPDAPTERGTKHLHELITCREAGYDAYVLFVIQMSGVEYFCPNDETDPTFGNALRQAARAGVKLLAVTCQVTPNSMRIDQSIPIHL